MTAPTHTDLSRDFGRMEATLEATLKRLDGLEGSMKDGFDGLKAEMRHLITAFEASQKEQDARIDDLESGKDKVLGVSTVAGWLMGAIGFGGLGAIAEFLHLGGFK